MRRLAFRFFRHACRDQFIRQGPIACEEFGAIQCEHPGTPCINPDISLCNDKVTITVLYAEKEGSRRSIDPRFLPIPLRDVWNPSMVEDNLGEDNLWRNNFNPNPNLGEAYMNPNLREAGSDPDLREAGSDPNLREADLDPNVREADIDLNLREDNLREAPFEPYLRRNGNLPNFFNQPRLSLNYEKLCKNMSMVHLGYLCMTNFKSFVDFNMDRTGEQTQDLLLLFEMYTKYLMPLYRTVQKNKPNDPPKKWLMIVGVV